MKTKILMLVVASGVFSACASGPSARNEATPEKSPTTTEVKPSYSEKVVTVSLERYSATEPCPKNSAWQSLPWKRQVTIANSCVRTSDWRMVEQIGNHLAVTSSLTPWGSYYLSLAAAARKDYPRALWMLELALKKAPGEGLFHFQSGRVQWEMGEYTSALKSFEQSVALNPDLVEAHSMLGQIALQREEMKTAESHLQKALSKEPSHLPSLMAMANFQIKNKNWQGVEQTLNQVIQLNPKSLKARHALAQIQELHLNQHKQALQSYRMIRQLSQERKLDERVTLNLEEKIKNLEKAVLQVNEEKQAVRQPAKDEKVAK